MPIDNVFYVKMSLSLRLQRPTCFANFITIVLFFIYAKINKRLLSEFEMEAKPKVRMPNIDHETNQYKFSI